MLDPAVPPREKYPQALKMFREALQLDPNNALAKDGIKLIEDIYKSMGRPVPE
jgi:tetratricopeptide (TPR) repeat protein